MKHRRSAITAIVTAVMVLIFVRLVGQVFASDATPVVEPVTEVASQEPTLVPTDVPTDVPTEVPPETAGPIPTSTPAAADSTPTEEDSPAPTSTPDSTIVPTATPEPRAISWSQPDPITCAFKRGNSPLHYGESAVYTCVASMTTLITGDLPDDLTTIWTLQASYRGGPVEFRLPKDSTDELLPPHDMPTDMDARIRVSTPFAQESVSFEIVISRTTCTVGEFPLAITADLEIQSVDGIEVIRRDEPAPDPFTLNTSFVPSDPPTVHFDGPITFEALSATSTGLESTISHGSAVIVVEGEWNPCTTWTLSMTGQVESPEVAPDFLVLSLNDEQFPGGVCSLSAPCDLLTLPQSGSAATPQIYTVQLALVFDPHTPPGSFTVSVNASLDSESGQP